MRYSDLSMKSVTTTAAQIVHPGKNRVALHFSAPLSDSYTLSTSASVISGAGMNMLPTGGPLLITRETHGDLVEKVWYAVSATATLGVGVIETVDVE